MLVYKMALLPLLTGLLITVKYALGMIPGVELTTFIIISYAAFLPLSWSLLISLLFVGLTGVLYGPGPWWVMYWFIWPSEVFFTWLVQRIIAKNNIYFAIWTGFWGFAIIFFYFLSDFVIGGWSYAIAQVSRAIFVNLIEGTINFVVALSLFYPVANIFKSALVRSDNLQRRTWKQKIL